MQINGIEAVELLASADPALAAQTRNRGRKPVVVRTADQPLTINGIEGVIWGTTSSGPGSVYRLDSADPLLALAARQRGQRAVLVVDSTGAVVPSTPAEAWYEEGTTYDALAAVMDFNNDRYALPSFGSELAVNPGFDTDTDWTKSAGTTIASGVATGAAVATGQNMVSQSATLTDGKLYAFTFTITAYTAGNIRPRFTGGTAVSGTSRNAVGTYTDYITAGAGNTSFGLNILTANFTGSIDNVSLKEVVLTATGRTYGSELVVNGDFATGPTLGAELVTNGDFATDTVWTKGTNWTISGGVSTISVPGATSTLSSSIGSLTVGTIYVVVFTVSGHAGGTISARLSGGSNVNASNRTANGTYTEYLTAVSGNNTIAFVANATANMSIDNVSVKELVAQPTGWLLKTTNIGGEQSTISGGTLNLTGDGTNQAWADQSFTTINGQVYEISYTLATAVSGINIGTSQGGTQYVNGLVSGAVGTYTYKFAATGATAWVRFFRTTATLGTVDNVSIRALTALGTYPKREATFDECFAYTAASDVARTYTDVNGVLKNDLAVNARRMTYANAKRQLRLENAGTNLCLRSEEFDNASWTATSVTVSPNAGAAPSGAVVADQIIEDGTNNLHGLLQSVTLSASTSYTFSLYAKYISRQWMRMAFNGATIAVGNAWFDLQNGVVGAQSFSTGTYVSHSITAVGSGWYRCVVTVTTAAVTGAVQMQLRLTDANSSVLSYSGTSSAYWWGAQVEASAFATDYIPTTTAAVTRAIETCRLSPLMEAVLQRAQGSVVVRGQNIDSVNNAGRLVGYDGTGGFAVASAGNNNRVAMRNGTTFTGNAIPASGDLDGSFGVASGFDASGRAIAFNAGTVVTDALGMDARTAIYLGRDNGPIYAHGYYDLLAIAPERLPNTDLQTLAVAAA